MAASPEGPWTGGCQCGAIRYELDPAAILTLYCCHCTECQRQAAGAFGMSMLLPPGTLRFTRGTPKTWQRGADSGGINRAHFCGGCGVRICHDGGPESDWQTLKPGTLDDTRALRPVGHIWTKSAQPWVLPLPADLLIYEGQPETDAALIAAWRDRRG